MPVVALFALAANAVAVAQPLAPAERAAVFEAAGLILRSDGRHARAGCDTPLKPDTETWQLNGRPAVFVFVGPSSCFEQGGGGNVALFIRDASGRWVDRLGFVPGVEAVRQETGSGGMPDIGIANAGGCLPVYRWDGARYARFSQRAIQPGGCQFRE